MSSPDPRNDWRNDAAIELLESDRPLRRIDRQRLAGRIMNLRDERAKAIRGHNDDRGERA